jgi:ketosteroid isomerase-like protein
VWDIVERFNRCISENDVDGISRLITDDHVFTDSAGGSVSGRQAVLAAWNGFFASFPDYRNEFGRHTGHGDSIAISDRSFCSDPRLDGPALWRAILVNGKLSVWEVHDDTPQNRMALGLQE